MNIIFRQLSDLRSSTYTYLLAEPASGEAILIDPVFEQAGRDAALLKELDLRLICTVDTHVHADHITAAWLLKQRLASQVAISASSNAEGADRLLEAGDRIHFGKRYVEVRSTPGHTRGCITLVLDDETMAFTGDALLIRGTGRTDFQEGDARLLYQSVIRQIFTLPDACLLYPAHDYRGLSCSSVLEEKRHNPRLGGQRSEADFVGFIDNLDLPHPHQIDVAVPANMKCGEADFVAEKDNAADWAPLNYTYAGIYEIGAEWVEENLPNIQLIDVRAEEEYQGILGHIKSAKLIPLDELRGRVDEISIDRPVVTVCRSGGRSTQAVVLLKKAGFARLANLAGGMIQWRSSGLPVVN